MDIGDPLDFTGRVVLVTGGTRGIGAVIAEVFLSAGAEVVVCGRHAPARLPGAEGRRAVFLPCDVRDPAAAVELVAGTVEQFGHLDVLVNNAGGSPDADAATVSPRFAEKIVALNLLAPFHVAQAANRVMRAQEGGGSMINIGSVSAHDPQPGTALYTAAKAGLLALTKALAREWAPRVRVNHLTTRLVRTQNAAAVYGEDGGAAAARVVPMERMAVPEDVARACLFLAGGLAGYVNGADLAVHGGGEVPSDSWRRGRAPRGDGPGRAPQGQVDRNAADSGRRSPSTRRQLPGRDAAHGPVPAPVQSAHQSRAPPSSAPH